MAASRTMFWSEEIFFLVEVTAFLNLKNIYNYNAQVNFSPQK